MIGKTQTSEDSWTSINVEDLALENSHVGDNMFLVLDDPVVNLYPDEEIVAKAHALDSGRHGTLFLTNCRLLFISFSTDDRIELPLSIIAYVKPCTLKNNESWLDLIGKNFMLHRFDFLYDCTTTDVVQRLLYLPQDQFTRLVSLTASKEQRYTPPKCRFVASEHWKLTKINQKYQVCDTYPSIWMVPACIPDNVWKKVALFRKRGRVPVTTYVHLENGASITRCAQPLVGFRRNRCIYDEKLIQGIRQTNPSHSDLYIIDCRSQTSAIGNIALGAGFETQANYPQTQIRFMGIENIHAMRESYHRLMDLVRSERREPTTQWYSRVETTRWLTHISSILRATAECVDLIAQQGASIMIHCSDGWDRTAQLVSLCKLALDPYYRTLHGFQHLIELEWCSFGHCFTQRCGNWNDTHTSPVFVQFIDAVWQCTIQFPHEFEFNAMYLRKLLDAVYDSRSSTFLSNSEYERMQVNGYVSIWDTLEKERNAFYAPETKILALAGETSQVELWSLYYLGSLNKKSNCKMEEMMRELQLECEALRNQMFQDDIIEEEVSDGVLVSTRRKTNQYTRVLVSDYQYVKPYFKH